jgi:osomolarity two-component system, sensor histidine kinase SLN1
MLMLRRYVNRNFVLDVSRNNLETAASLKARELAVSIDLLYTSALYLTASAVLQEALERYNNGTDTSSSNFNAAAAVLTASLSAVGPLKHAPAVQSQVYPRNTSGPLGQKSVLNVTGTGADITLPWLDNTGRPARLGEIQFGFPPTLYPNLTISETTGANGTVSYLATYDGVDVGIGDGLILGPLIIDYNVSLMSLTLPVVRIIINYAALVLTKTLSLD